jgi:hypothetical protein
MESCKGCLRDTSGGCEALKHRTKECFAKETDVDKYIKGQKELIKYNQDRNSTVPCTQAFKNIKRVLRGRVDDNTKL